MQMNLSTFYCYSSEYMNEYVYKTLSFAAEINTVVTYVGIGAGSGLLLGILVSIIIKRLCRRRNQPKSENQTRDIKRKHDQNIQNYGLKCHRACSQHCPEDTGPVSLVNLRFHKKTMCVKARFLPYLLTIFHKQIFPDVFVIIIMAYRMFFNMCICIKLCWKFRQLFLNLLNLHFSKNCAKSIFVLNKEIFGTIKVLYCPILQRTNHITSLYI